VTAHHLLSGHLRCGICGGNLYVAPVSGKRGKPSLFYRCTTHHKRGDTRCVNKWGVPYDTLTAAVLSHFQPETLATALVRAMDDPLPMWDETDRERIKADLGQAEQEALNLLTAIKAGGSSIPIMVQELAKAQARVDNLRAALAHVDAMAQEMEPPTLEDLEDLRAQVYEPLTLRNAPEATGRRVLRSLLTEPITVSPVIVDGKAKGWEYLGHGALDRVLVGRLGSPMPVTSVVPPARNAQRWNAPLTVTLHGRVT